MSNISCIYTSKLFFFAILKVSESVCDGVISKKALCRRLEMCLLRIDLSIKEVFQKCFSIYRSSHQKVLFWIAVLHVFDSFDEKSRVMVYIFRKAALAALQKIHTLTGDIWIIWGMIKRTANLKKTSGKLLLKLAFLKPILHLRWSKFLIMQHAAAIFKIHPSQMQDW